MKIMTLNTHSLAEPEYESSSPPLPDPLSKSNRIS